MKSTLSAADRAARVRQLKQLVGNGEYRIDPLAVAVALVRKSSQPTPPELPSPQAKRATNRNS